MAISKQEIQDWLNTLSNDASVAIDDGGLQLVEVGTDDYLEVGGIPLPQGECKRCGSDLDESGYCPDITCPYSDHFQDETWTKG